MVKARSDTPQPGAGGRSASASCTTGSPRDQTSVLNPENKEIVENPFLSTSESGSSSESDNDTPWKTIDHRRYNKKRAKAKKRQVNKDLVAEAEKLLTNEEKQRILKRKLAEEHARPVEQSPLNLGEGTSKGKNVDPRNWGDAEINESDLDIEAQKEALNTWADSREWAKDLPNPEPVEDSDQESDTVVDPVQAAVKAAVEKVTKQFEGRISRLQNKLEESKSSRVGQPTNSKKKKPSTNPVKDMVERVVKKPSKRHEHRPTPPAVDAVAQIARESYLGRAFEQIK
ncbi:hypothetical protein P692DRAFT_20748122, partial [Suillus brevipes Sb2]